MNGRRNLDMVLAVCIFLAVLAGPAGADTYIVDPCGGGHYYTIQAAIDDPCTVNGDQIEVVSGTYNEAIDFKGKAIRLYSRDGPDVTTIDGTGHYHVIQCANNEDANTILEGFTITGGDASEFSYPNDCGGGMFNSYTSPTVTDCNFIDNWADSNGGGMYNEGGSPTVTNCTFYWNVAVYGGGMFNYDSSSPTVTNCNFSGNSAVGYGGGMYNCDNSSPTVTNCNFSGNSAVYGGGMENYPSSSPKVTNCTFSSNSAVSYGGGMDNWTNSNPTVTNCTFSGNSAMVHGGGMYNSNSSPRVTNCILWGDEPEEIYNSSSSPIVSYSDVEGGTGESWFGTGCIDNDPCFVDGAGGDFHLPFNSPCIDAGDNNSVPADTADLDGDGNTTEPIPFDLDGVARVVDGNDDGSAVVDMGAYELRDIHNITQDKWYISIQAAIDDAHDIDQIEVGPGTYNEAIDFKGKAITLRSSNPNDPNIVAATVINGTGHYHVVQCVSGEDANTILEGFTITGGNANGQVTPGDGSGGGMYNWGNSSPTVTNCTFSGNSAHNGGGMFNYGSSPTVTNCNFSGNSTNYSGGGMSSWLFSSPTVTNCTFSGNTCEGSGGGMGNFSSSPTVTNCTFSGNSADDGGGMCNYYSSSPTVTNCTFSGNSAGWNGGAMYTYGEASYPNVTNCILWGDTPDEIFDAGSSSTTVNYSDVEGAWGGAGANNINADPCFVDADSNDFYLLANSLCIDAGDNNSVPADTADLDGDGNTVEPIPFDADGRARVVDGNDDGTAVVDMGAYEFQRIHNITQDTWYRTIQAAIDDANDDDEIEVTPATYYEAINFNGKAVRLYSSGGPDVTIIDGTGHYHVVQCVSGEDANTILEGFTITGGDANGPEPNDQRGGGMLNYNSSPTVADCNFSGNSGYYGGGMRNMSGSSPTVTNCTFSGNSAVNNGGGMSNHTGSSPTVTNCIFSDNSTDYYGGGMCNAYDSSPTVADCNFSGNSAGLDGGGMGNYYNSSPTVSNCTFSGNLAIGNDGGGINNETSNPVIADCTFIGNSAYDWGGAMRNISSSSPTLTNCIFAGNSSDDGGGMFNYDSSSPTVTNCTFSGNIADANGGGMINYYSNPTVTNCIFWDDTPNEILDVDSTTTVTYSDVEGGYGGPDSNNIDADPCFVDAAGGNLRLGLGSPCIDAADNSAVPADTSDLDGDGNSVEPTPFDLGGLPRFVDDLCTGDTGNGTPPIVDMGAYEFLAADIDGSGGVDLWDLCEFALHWGETGCGRCGGANMTCDAGVDWNDLRELSAWWLAGK